MHLPARLLNDPAVAKALEICERAKGAKLAAEAEFNRLGTVGVPSCSEPFDEDAGAARLRRAKRYDEIHGTDTAAAEVAAIDAERAACKKAHTKSAAEAQAAAARLEDARLEHEAAAAVASDTEGRLWGLIVARAQAVLPELQAEYVKAAAALRAQALELRAVNRAVQQPFAPYDDSSPFEFEVPLPWRNGTADELTRQAGGIVAATGRLTFR